MTFCPPWHIGYTYHFLSFYLAQFLIFFHIFFSSFIICVSDSLLFLLVFTIFFYFTFVSTGSWVTLLLFFLSLCSFNPTFQSIPHNSHPQLMALPWVKVHNTQSWVRDIKRLFTALATLNLCFWHKLRCTCPRKDQGQHIILRKNQLGWKWKVYFKFKSFR